MNTATMTHRSIAYRTRGRRHGPIVRLVSPPDVGQFLKPFVFLDFVDVAADSAPAFSFHPHSGIATLTLLLEGGFEYEDSTGATGTVGAGSVEWMQAGGGVWHTGKGTGERIKGYQLWVALPPELENGPALSRYLGGDLFGSLGPATVILGQLGDVRSPIDAPSRMNYLHVRLRDGEVWHYDPPPGHDVAWIAVHEGQVLAGEPVLAGELAAFAEGRLPITFEAKGNAGFVLGSAVKHGHDLVLGDYSVHTHAGALERGETNIRRLAVDLRRAGKL